MNDMMESKLLETHFDVIPFDIYVVDVATLELVFLNRHFRDHLGDLAGRTCYEALHELSQPCHFCKIKGLINKDGSPNGHVHIYELFNEKDDRWLQLQEKTLSWPDGRVVKYSIAVDITELKETQNRLAEAHAKLALSNKELRGRNEMLQENVRLREHINRMSSHDLKNSLSAVINLPQLIIETCSPSEETVGMLRVIEEAGVTMLQQLNQSLDLYKLEAGSYAIKHDSVDVAEVARRSIAGLSGLAKRRRISVLLTQHGAQLKGTESLRISGEALLCQTMLMNLVKNAIEASPMGEQVRVELEEVGEMARISVLNIGELPEHVRERFFEKYLTAGKPGGTGLGTHSAKLAAEAHGGRMELDLSQPGMVRVNAYLPLYAKSASAKKTDGA